MVRRIPFNRLSQKPEIIFSGGFFGFLDMSGELGDDDGGEDAEDGDDDHQLDEGEGGRLSMDDGRWAIDD